MIFASLRSRWAGFLGAFVALALGVALTAAMGVGLAASTGGAERAPQRFAGAPVVVAGRDTLSVPVRRGPETERVSERLAHPHPVDKDLLAALRRLGPVRGSGPPDRGSRLPDAVGVSAPVGAVRAAVAASGTGARVLTGADRARVDPGAERDGRALVAVNAFLGTAGGVAVFVSAFVTASTFAFVVALRRRELGLLRAAGASRGQVRRWLLGEALVVGAAAAATGCTLGALGAPRLARALVDAEVAPPWFTVAEGLRWTWWPYQLAFWTGLLVAVAGAWSAARRAARVSPVEALREASLDTGVMPPGRRVAGAALLAGALGLLAWTLWSDPSDLLKRKTYTTQPMILATAVAALAPLLVRHVVALFRWPVPARPGRVRRAAALARVVRANSGAGVRRTAAVAAPVLVTVALAGCLLGSAATVGAAKAAEARQRTAADLVVTGDGTGGGLRPVGPLPGATVAASAATAVFVPEDEGSAVVRAEARAVADPAAFAAVTRLPVVAGDVRDLDDRSIVVDEEWQHRRVGDRVAVWLGDGRRARLRIVAVLARGTGDNGAYVTARNAAAAPVDRLDVRLRAGADRAAVARALRASGGEVRPVEDWLAAAYPGMRPQTRLGLLVLLALCLAYAAISLVATLLMTAPVRAPELRSLRLAGATRAQLRLVAAGEAGLAVAVGAVLGLAVTAVGLGGLALALARLSVPVEVVVPWGAMGVCAGVCGAVAVVAGVAGLPGPAVHRAGALVLKRRTG
ncbi:FtsX-like permease family protein [Streptomyces spectabilis]|uniref:FtsX-like permease family protein n=1 Tax=Streptomyces spectabilis TaxID=68270 RepID=A0A5P2X8H6_STRST|nr:FtsX-like permease family protein [Streptomyces spectabilis]MBB5103581.1 putative ABC transport system permease protein [Streptomyces spectabilis]MCI3904173.1 FtsX-like permease family protein [Streptomyces spectabilis]QEV61297.1 FtsX-like permease family protein [Streptomyces spectabilis]GGV19930.1 ABC transporter permease [Streptomyces spectabilis]